MRINQSARRNQLAFTLTEAIVSLTLSLVTIGGLVSGFLQSATESEWSSYSLAAQSQAIRSLEQVRAAKWDPLGFPAVDQVVPVNFPPRIEILDIPMRGDNIVYVTNFTTIASVSANPALKLVQVESVWCFMNRGLFTNTAFTYRAPDQ
jgi:hypothetical protein